jgi:hypothetical protein
MKYKDILSKSVEFSDGMEVRLVLTELGEKKGKTNFSIREYSRTDAYNGFSSNGITIRNFTYDKLIDLREALNSFIEDLDKIIMENQ